MTKPEPQQLHGRKLMVLEADLDPPQVNAQTPVGERKIVMVRGGRFSGERLSGEVLPGGGDWALTRPDGVLLLDVRLVLRCNDGVLICLTYSGLRHGPAEVMQRLARGEQVAASEYYFRIVPRFETGDARYTWLNRVICVGFGERLLQGPRYTIFEIL